MTVNVIVKVTVTAELQISFSNLKFNCFHCMKTIKTDLEITFAIMIKVKPKVTVKKRGRKL